MPTVPKIRDARREVRHCEVLGKNEAEEPRAADCDIAVAGEIEIDLHPESEDRAPRRRRPRVGRDRAKIRIGCRRELIGNSHFLEETKANARESVTYVVGARRSPRIKLAEEKPRSYDRPGEQLREKSQIERVVERLADRAHPATIDVDEIRNALEGVKANPDRNEEIDQPRIFMHAEQRGDGAARQVRVLEAPEKGQIRRNAEAQ